MVHRSRIGPILALCLGTVAFPAWAAPPIVAIDMDPSTPEVIDFSVFHPGPLAWLDVGVIVDASGTTGISSVQHVVLGVTQGFNRGGAVVTSITPLSMTDLIPGPPAGSVVSAGGAFEFGIGLSEAGSGVPFTGGPVQYAVVRLVLGMLPPGSTVRVFIGDAGPGTGSVLGPAGIDLSGDWSRDGTPVWGTSGKDQGWGAGLDYRDGFAVFGRPSDCGSAAAPACDGDCPAGYSCDSDLPGTSCSCVPDPVPCGAADAPLCDGACPGGGVCRASIDGTTCECAPEIACGSSTAPECGGDCPPGQGCGQDAAGSGCVCQPVDMLCEEAGAPACGGECLPGRQCMPDGHGRCGCAPVATACSDSSAPACGGACPLHRQCRPDPASGVCICMPFGAPCADADAPACGGRCTLDDQECTLDTQTGACRCQSVPCGQSEFATCGGRCPSGYICRPDLGLGECGCVPGTVPCGSASAPECGGECPPGLVCEVDPLGSLCVCQSTAPVCGDSAAPTCGGDCPEGLECRTDSTGAACFCQGPIVTCGDGPAPACDGTCPEGLLCRPELGDLGCDCVSPPPSCDLATAPLCGGMCPSGSQCLPDFLGNCSCSTCDEAAPAGDVILGWQDADTLIWSGQECATSYSVYRSDTASGLQDSDGDGLADDYGSCIAQGLTAKSYVDRDPVTGSSFYLVVGVNSQGLGSAGLNSLLVERPLSNCP